VREEKREVRGRGERAGVAHGGLARAWRPTSTVRAGDKIQWLIEYTKYKTLAKRAIIFYYCSSIVLPLSRR
jgi:hypothetical protein